MGGGGGTVANRGLNLGILIALSALNVFFFYAGIESTLEKIESKVQQSSNEFYPLVKDIRNQSDRILGYIPIRLKQCLTGLECTFLAQPTVYMNE